MSFFHLETGLLFCDKDLLGRGRILSFLTWGNFQGENEDVPLHVGGSAFAQTLVSVSHTQEGRLGAGSLTHLYKYLKVNSGLAYVKFYPELVKIKYGQHLIYSVILPLAYTFTVAFPSSLT